MRRIYESAAVERDETPFTPGRREAEPESFRSIPAASASRLLLPDRLRYRAISIRVEAGRDHAAVGERLPFAVTLRNSMPFPVTIPTVSPVLWTWRVDGHEGAARYDRAERTDEPRAFTLGRGERKRFVRGWDGRFQVSESEWEPAPVGTYELGVAVNVESPARRGLTDETTIEIREE
ncbi:hypothetical protein [Halovivax limisalsi]|uniref:hypothetical protein n=1 Tax=Halovivax limisalsi TaxID=1453760 RepID=UPI001FFD3EDD|nr:hypothetical protein [Halovivax limisalsi]